MAKRKTISKKTRFEVFKRDNFTCQYCGRMAPDVILEVDHINPVANGGENDIMNLVTSCRDCNRGKGKKALSNKDEIKIQQEQLKELSQKREQLEMMIQWREELSKLDDMQINVVEKIFEKNTGHTFTEYGRNNISKFIKKYGISLVCDAVTIYSSTYYDDENDTFTKKFETIGGICHNKQKQQDDPSIYWINKIAYCVNQKFPYVDKWKIRNMINGKITSAEHCEEILEILNSNNKWRDFKSEMEENLSCQQ